MVGAYIDINPWINTVKWTCQATQWTYPADGGNEPDDFWAVGFLDVIYVGDVALV